MTITANPVRNQYTAAPNQTVFNYTYKIYSDNDLSVYVTPAGQAPDDSADLITSYTVDPGTIGNQSGGFITLDTGANSGDIITIASAIEYDRETDYQVNGDFSPETVNGDIDRVVSLVKQNKGDINRAVLLPESAEEGSEQVSIPSPDDQKGLKWESGNLANTPIVEGVTTDSNEFGLVSTTGNDVKIRGLKSGQNVTLTDDGTDILIKAEVQGGQGDVSSSSSNTYAPGTTQAFDAATASTMSVGGVDFTAKNAAQDAEIERQSFLLSFRDVSANEWDNYKSIKLSKSTSESNPDSNSASLNIKGSSAYKIITKSYAEGLVTGSGNVSIKIEIENIAGSSLKTLEFLSVTNYSYDAGYGSAAIAPTKPSINPSNNFGRILLSPMLLDNSGELNRMAVNESCIDLNVAEPSDELQVKISLSNQGSNGTIDKAFFTVSVERCDFLP